MRGQSLSEHPFQNLTFPLTVSHHKFVTQKTSVPILHSYLKEAFFGAFSFCVVRYGQDRDNLRVSTFFPFFPYPPLSYLQVVVLDTCGVSTALPLAAPFPAALPAGFVATWRKRSTSRWQTVVLLYGGIVQLNVQCAEGTVMGWLAPFLTWVFVYADLC